MTALTLESSLETFSRRFARSNALSREGKKVIPGGQSRDAFNFGPYAVYIESGEGAYVRTVDGHRLLDLNNTLTTNVLGHRHPAVQAALLAAAETGISFGNPVQQETQLAQILVDRIPSVEKVQFTCSASEACMIAIRLARAYTGRTKVAKFEGGYHGFTDPLQISVHPDPDDDCGPDEAPHGLPESRGVPAEDVNNVIVLTQNDLEASERILRANADDTACLIMELESAAGGLVTLEPGFVGALRALTSELGIALIFDETVTLRAGYHGMQGMYDVTPDLTVMGKMIGGGLPLGAVGGGVELMGVLEDGRVSVAGTHHGHKLAVAAGIATMSEMTPDVFTRLNTMAARVLAEMNEWSGARGSAFQVYGAGISHMAFAYMREPGLSVRTHRDYWRNVDDERTQTISLELANRGFFPVARGDFSLSVPMTDEDITAFIDSMRAIVEEMEWSAPGVAMSSPSASL